MDITDFNNKGKKPINMISPKPRNPQQPFSPQFTSKSHIYSPQPITPKSFNSHINSPQPFTPVSQINSPKPFSPLHSSKLSIPKRSKTPNQFTLHSLNNSPFEMASSSNSSQVGNSIHHSNSTSGIYIKNNEIPTAISTTTTNMNSLYPPSYSYEGKHNNKASCSQSLSTYS